jgi:hypothetical protein
MELALRADFRVCGERTPVRAAGDPARDHPRGGRHPAAAAADRPGPGQEPRVYGPVRRRPGGAADRAGRPVGFRNSATSSDLGFYAARSYSLMKPPRTGRRLIRSWERSAAG